MKFVTLAVACFGYLSPMVSIAVDTETSSITSAPNSHGSDLRALLREVGTRTHKHFILDPRAPQSIDLGGLDHLELTYSQLLSVLQVSGLAVVADDGLMQVLLNTDVRQSALPVVDPDAINTLPDEWITSVIPTSQLVPILRPMIPQQGHLAAFQDRNALIIVDRSANVKRLYQTIKTLEKLPKFVDSSVLKAP